MGTGYLERFWETAVMNSCCTLYSSFTLSRSAFLLKVCGMILGKWKQEEQEFKVTFGYIVSLRPAQVTWDPNYINIYSPGMQNRKSLRNLASSASIYT